MEASSTSDKDEVKHEGLQSEQNIQYSTVTLLSLLNFKNETLAKTQAKEKVTQCKLQLDLNKLQHLKEWLEPSLTELTELKSKLDNEAKLEDIYKSQMKREVQNSEKMKEVLSVNYKRIQKNYESKLEKASLLESEYKNSFQDYILQRENAKKVYNDKKAVLIEIMNKKEMEKLQFETDMNKKIYDFEKLKESNKSIEVNVVKHKQELAHSQNECDKNVAILEALNKDLCSAKNSLACMDVKIEEIEVMRIQARERNSEKLTSMENEMEVAKKKLEQLQQMEINAQEEFKEKCNKIQDLENVLEKLEDENSTMSMEADELRHKRKDLEDKANADLGALKVKREALFAKRQKLDEALTAVKLCKEEKLNSGRSLGEKISNSNNKITKLTELLEKYDQEMLTKMAKKEVFVQNHLSLKLQIDNLRSSISTKKKNRMSSQERYNKVNSNLNFKISVAQSELQEAKCKYEGTKKNLEQELNGYKYEQQKIYQQNEDDCNQILEGNKTKCVTLQNLIQEENNSLSHLDNLIFEKKTLYDKLQQDLKVLRGVSTSSSRIADKKPTSILKAPRKPTVSPKKVTFEGKGNDTESENSSQPLK